MSRQGSGVRLSVKRLSVRGERTILLVAVLLSAAASGCGSDLTNGLRPGAVTVLSGSDSAGATIELKMVGASLVSARVIDSILGTGQAGVTTGEDGAVDFTIDFPAGATITYTGRGAESDDPGSSLSGSWIQHAGGIFGADAGTWLASRSTGSE